MLCGPTNVEQDRERWRAETIKSEGPPKKSFLFVFSLSCFVGRDYISIELIDFRDLVIRVIHK